MNNASTWQSNASLALEKQSMERRRILTLIIAGFLASHSAAVAHERTGPSPIGEQIIFQLADILRERSLDADFLPESVGKEGMAGAAVNAVYASSVEIPALTVTKIVKAFQLIRNGDVDAKGNLIRLSAGWGIYNEIADEDFVAVASRFQDFVAFERRLVEAAELSDL